MRRRAAAASILSASAVLVISWQMGAQAHVGSPGLAAPTASGTTPAGTTGGSEGSATTGTSDASTSTGSASSAGGTSDTGIGTDTGTSAQAPAAAGPSGTFTGAVASTRFGDVQVQIIVADGSITDVEALHLTDADGRSVQISNSAAPVLREEVLSAQSASVQMVSGATYTSEAYLTSLQSAIDQAGL
ncbi:FMN-binding protein [Leifsonia sp. Leaf264]|uniref:FMN-binding protein n=1 Tax=Leifsonia sp. Leaf264 TaxID=1736314 RepID=UPI0006FD4796|nr:FMN-binding protein [Leifsonia sp. Leaf264]KQO93789.1 hypothetical protein ASF30_21520 [Leifsonia sp. Leaf264]